MERASILSTSNEKTDQRRQSSKRAAERSKDRGARSGLLGASCSVALPTTTARTDRRVDGRSESEASALGMTTNALHRQTRRRHFSTWCQKPLSCFDPGSTGRGADTEWGSASPLFFVWGAFRPAAELAPRAAALAGDARWAAAPSTCSGAGGRRGWGPALPLPLKKTWTVCTLCSAWCSGSW